MLMLNVQVFLFTNCTFCFCFVYIEYLFESKGKWFVWTGKGKQ